MCFTYGQCAQINKTSSASLPRKSSRRTVLPVTASVNAKSGAIVPSSSMVDSVSAILSLLHMGCFSTRKDASVHRLLKQPRLPPRHSNSKVLIGQSRSHAAARSAIQKPNLNQKRLVDFFERVLFLGKCCRQRAQ